MMKQVCIKTRDYNLGAYTTHFVYKSSNGLFYATPEEALRGDKWWVEENKKREENMKTWGGRKTNENNH